MWLLYPTIVHRTRIGMRGNHKWVEKVENALSFGSRTDKKSKRENSGQRSKAKVRREGEKKRGTGAQLLWGGHFEKNWKEMRKEVSPKVKRRSERKWLDGGGEGFKRGSK